MSYAHMKVVEEKLILARYFKAGLSFKKGWMDYYFIRTKSGSNICTVTIKPDGKHEVSFNVKRSDPLYNLEITEYFNKPLQPTRAELTMFKLDVGVEYPLEKHLKTYVG